MLDGMAPLFICLNVLGTFLCSEIGSRWQRNKIFANDINSLPHPHVGGRQGSGAGHDSYATGLAQPGGREGGREGRQV